MTHRVDKPTEMSRAELTNYMRSLIAGLAFQNALAQCIEEGREYTEIHFWLNRETEEFVLTYWKID